MHCGILLNMFYYVYCLQMEDSGKRMIVKAMKDHLKSEEVQILGCQILNNLITGGMCY